MAVVGVHGCSLVDARISAMWIERTPVCWRDSEPPIFIRQEESPPVTYSAPVSLMWRTLSVTIAWEVSAFLMAKVPPKPQHSSLFGSSTNSMRSEEHTSELQ